MFNRRAWKISVLGVMAILAAALSVTRAADATTFSAEGVTLTVGLTGAICARSLPPGECVFHRPGV